MGVKYEFNWYLVVAKEEDLKQLSDEIFITTKSEARIYPINAEIPVIIKGRGCLGMVRIKQFTVSENETTVYFSYTIRLSEDDSIAQHYYTQYLAAKG